MRQTTQLRGLMRMNEPLFKHTSWRVGGSADYFYQPADLEDLKHYLATLSADQPIYWLGLGSNVLVRDQGIRGTVICTSGVLNGITVNASAHRIYVEAGVACPKIAKVCAKHDLVGAEFLCGIPGTLGGALAMNAGAFGGETWSLVAQVHTVDRHGQAQVRTRGDYVIGYRSVRGAEGEWFVAAELQLNPGDGNRSQALIKDLLAKRAASQPTQQANAGSVFRNPPGDYAARLIERCGLKGLCIGGACVSEKHANFIVNLGTATAADIEELIMKVQRIVHEQTGVQLIPEIHVIGETNDSHPRANEC